MMPLENDLLTIEEYITVYKENVGFVGKVVAVFGAMHIQNLLEIYWLNMELSCQLYWITM